MAEEYEKETKSAVDYSLGGDHCGVCKFFVPPESGDDEIGTCKRVLGPISEDMWCKRFKRKGSKYKKMSSAPMRAKKK